jgi:hypothetical protein
MQSDFARLGASGNCNGSCIHSSTAGPRMPENRQNLGQATMDQIASRLRAARSSRGVGRRNLRIGQVLNRWMIVAH